MITGSQEQVKAALALIHKLTGKKGYQPDAYPNPGSFCGQKQIVERDVEICLVLALALHYGWLEATAFDEEYDPESSFEDHTRPPYDRIHLRAGALMKEWKDLVDADPNAHIMSAEATRRPAVRSKSSALSYLR